MASNNKEKILSQENEIQVRVTYSNTDRMGFAYYAEYLVWFEMGRTEWLRQTGISYKSIEERGVLLPIRHCYCEYKAPAQYDDVLRIISRVKEITPVSITFSYQVLQQEDGKLLASGETKHAFINPQGRIIKFGLKLLKEIEDLGN